MKKPRPAPASDRSAARRAAPKAADRPAPALRISARGRTALKAIFEIAYGDGGPVHSRAIAERAGLAEAFVQQTTHALRKAGLVLGKRGPKGGFTMGKEPRLVSLGDVLRAAEATPVLVDTGGEPLGDRAGALWREIDDKVVSLFDGITLEDLVRRAGELAIPRATAEREDPILYYI
jgi:Rrf2 family protein